MTFHSSFFTFCFAKVLPRSFLQKNPFQYGKTFLTKKKCYQKRNTYLGKLWIYLTFAIYLGARSMGQGARSPTPSLPKGEGAV